MEKQIVIVGTSHIARQSIRRVREAIDNIDPDIVCVELDHDRYSALLAEKQNKNMKTSSIYAIRKIGLKGFLFASFGSWGMKKLGKLVGTNPGSDMLAAIKHAKKKGKKVALIDQNINITLKRLSKALSFRDFLRFFADSIKGALNPEKEMKKYGLEHINLTKVPSERVVEKMIRYLKIRYPKLYKVLVRDRNHFMVRNIVRIIADPDVRRMVVVVGAGHKSGMMKILSRSSARLSKTQSKSSENTKSI